MADLITLTGAPLIARAEYPVRVVTCAGERVKRAHDGRSRRTLLQERIRPTGTLELTLTSGQLLGLLADVSTPTWTLTVRTPAQGEAGTPLEMTVYTTSDLPLTGLLRRRFVATGEVAIPVALSWRSTLTYAPETLGLS